MALRGSIVAACLPVSVAMSAACGSGGDGDATPSKPDATSSDGTFDDVALDGAVTPLSCGARTDGWTDVIAREGAPSSVNYASTFFWTGSELLVVGYPILDDKARMGLFRYDLAAKAWSEIPTTGAPFPRQQYGSVLVGTKLYLWGGRDALEKNPYSGVLGTGLVLDLVTHAWTETSATSAPIGRVSPSMVWTGARILVWNGIPDLRYGSYATDTGALYDPATDTWSPIAPAGTSKNFHTGVWAGSRFVSMTAGRCYDPAVDVWSACGPSLEGAAQVGFAGGAIGLGAKAPASALVMCAGSDGGVDVGGEGGVDGGADGGCVRVDAGAPPEPRSQTSMGLLIGSKAVYYGGQEKGRTVGNGIAYDVATGTWGAFAPGGPAQNGARLVWTGSQLVVWPLYPIGDVLGCVFTP
jgi:hypothetical protein